VNDFLSSAVDELLATRRTRKFERTSLLEAQRRLIGEDFSSFDKFIKPQLSQAAELYGIDKPILRAFLEKLLSVYKIYFGEKEANKIAFNVEGKVYNVAAVLADQALWDTLDIFGDIDFDETVFKPVIRIAPSSQRHQDVDREGLYPLLKELFLKAGNKPVTALLPLYKTNLSRGAAGIIAAFLKVHKNLSLHFFAVDPDFNSEGYLWESQDAYNLLAQEIGTERISLTIAGKASPCAYSEFIEALFTEEEGEEKGHYFVIAGKEALINLDARQIPEGRVRLFLAEKDEQEFAVFLAPSTDKRLFGIDWNITYNWMAALRLGVYFRSRPLPEHYKILTFSPSLLPRLLGQFFPREEIGYDTVLYELKKLLGITDDKKKG
jgi:hypothetical protein